jgi:murein tripeptide amidase MpaA
MYRTVAQLDSLSSLLAQFFPQLVSRFQLAEASVQGRPVFALRLRAGGGQQERRGVLLVGGTHARELMNPDMLIELAVDLVISYRNGTDLVLGNRTWAAADLKLIMDTLDLYIVPCINPDGRIHVMTVDDLWRKNRRDNPGTPCDGVDLNRNFDLLWGVTEGQTSCSPCSDVYAGSSAFSEPETRNVRQLLDTHRIDCFVDVHSFSELVLYPWGHAATQTTDSSKRFTTLPSGTCQPIGIPGYQEYLDPRDLLRFETVAQRVVDAIAAVRGRVYSPQSGIGLYPTTGTQSDYVYGRHIANPNSRKVYGYTIETGPQLADVRESFHPTDPEPVKTESESGVLALVQQCICAIELIGGRLLGARADLSGLRRVRDQMLGTTAAGREWIALFERVQTPLMGVVLADERLGARAAELVEQAVTLVDDDQVVLDDALVERSVGVLLTLQQQSGSRQVRAELRLVERRLRALSGRTSREVIENLMAEAP